MSIHNMAMAALIMASATPADELYRSRRYSPPQRDTSPITLAERNRLLNAAAAKHRKNAKRKAAEKARRAK